ncbi:hypothetical protein [Alkaliphilus transvaalensis]|uniref:hypothetical protein n=1 Tax=Alkaliphilus transvaalensis TaxID=114628 RepID=UPI00047D6C6B|nr:hypothetical protein [Alkaliphilus transvaalensis]
MSKSKKFKKETIKLNGNEAFIKSANKLNKSMPEVSRGCGVIGDKKFNRKKSKRAIQKEIQNFKDGSFINPL